MRLRRTDQSIFALVIICLCFVISSFSVIAQPDAVARWRYGYRLTPGEKAGETIDESYDLMGYTLEGEVEVILTGLNDTPRLFDLADNQVFAVVAENGMPAYYEIENVEATSIPLNIDDQPEVGSDGRSIFDAYALVGYRPPYALLNSVQGLTQMVVVNMETHTVQLSDHPPYLTFESCCLLRDDGKLQYITKIENEAGALDDVHGLFERDLETGEEQVLFDEPGFLIRTINGSGDRWLLQVNDRETGEKVYVVWEGNAQVSREIVEQKQRMGWIGDVIYREDALCEPTCAIELRFPDGTVNTRDADAIIQNRQLSPRYVLSDGSLIGWLQDPQPGQIVKILPTVVSSFLEM